MTTAEDASKGNKKMVSERLLKKWYLAATTDGSNVAIFAIKVTGQSIEEVKK